MTGLFWIMATASFATVAFLTYGVLSYLNNRKVVRDRFKQASTDSMPLIYRGEVNSFKKQFLDWISSLGHYAVDEKKDDSQLRQTLVQAGFRHPKGPAIYFGIRFLLALLLPVIFLLANVMNGVFYPAESHGLSHGGRIRILYCSLLAQIYHQPSSGSH